MAKELAFQRDEIVDMAGRTMGKGRALSAQFKELDPARRRDFTRQVSGFIESRAVPRLKAVTYPLVVDTGAAGLRAVAAQTGLSFRVLQPGLADYAFRETEFLAESMGKTLGEAVASTVQASLNAGETVRGLQDRLRGEFAFSRDRAKLVARTETTRAWNGAQQRSLQEYQGTTGQQVVKTWLSSQDDRVRPEHEELDGEQRPIDEAFSNGLMAPGEPNCRCTLTYSVIGEVEAPPEEPPVEEPPPAEAPPQVPEEAPPPPFEEVPQVEPVPEPEPELPAELIAERAADAALLEAVANPAATVDEFVSQVAAAYRFSGRVEVVDLPGGTAGTFTGSLNKVRLNPSVNDRLDLLRRSLRRGEVTTGVQGNAMKTLLHELNHAVSGQHVGWRDIEYAAARNRNLEEGMTEFLAQRRLERLGLKSTHVAYKTDVAVIERLAEVVGEDTVARIYRHVPKAGQDVSMTGTWRYARIREEVLRAVENNPRYHRDKVARFAKEVQPAKTTLAGLSSALKRLSS